MMTSLIGLTNSMSDRWVSWILAGVLDTSALLVLVGVLWFAIRRRVSPQVGYCLFLLVPLKLLLPVSVTVPAAMAKWIPSVVVTSWFEGGIHVGRNESRRANVTHDTMVMPHEPTLSEVDIVALPMRSEAVPTVSDESNRQINAPIKTTVQAVTPIASRRPRLSASAFAMIVWFLGVLYLLGRLFLTQLRFRKRLRQLAADEESRLDLDLRELCGRVGVSQEVRVIVSDDVTAPAVWGISRPTIILPRRVASSLSSQQLQWVLLHELAHIQRADLLVVACQRLAAALHFFNPAIWIANRMIHRLREYACDDLAVLLSDGSAVDSGEAFLLILRQASQSRLHLNGALGVFGLDSRAGCFSRVRRLMDTDRSIRIGIDRLSLCWLFLLAAIALPHIHAAQVAKEPEPIAQSKDATEPRAVANGDSPKPDNPNPNNSALLAKDVGEFELSIVGPEGKPIPGATVEFRTDPIPTSELIKQGKFISKGDKGALVSANSDGRIVMTVPQNPGRFDLRIVTAGYGPYLVNWSSTNDSEQIPAKFTAELETGWSIGGMIVDGEGNPVQGAKVNTRISFKTRPGVASRTPIGTISTTDATGKWRFDSVPPAIAANVEIDHPDFMPTNEQFRRRDYQSVNGQELVEQKTVLERGLTVIGKVTDEKGAVVVGARVFGKVASYHIRDATTGNDGIYRLPGCESQTTRLVVTAKGRAPEAKDVQIEPVMESVDFVLRPAGTIRVRILDEMNNPIPKANLVFRHWRGKSFGYFEFDNVNRYADEQGIWEWNEAPLDEFKADICRPNGLCLSEQSLKASDEEYVFRIPSALVVIGKVVDADTKEPVKTFQVTTANRFEPNYKDLTLIGRVTSTDGKYRIEQAKGSERRRNANRIQIESSGYQSTDWREFKFDAAGTATMDFELTKWKDVEAKVSVTTANAIGNSLPSACIAELNRNVQSLNTCMIKYTQQLEFPPQPQGSPIPLRAKSIEGYCVLDGGRFYHRFGSTFPDLIERAQSSRGNRTRYEEESFDGHIFYFGAAHLSPKSVNRYLGENTNDKEAQIRSVHVAYLEAAGFLVPKTISDWRSSVFDSVVLKAVNEGKILNLTEDGSILILEMEIPDQTVLYYQKFDLDKMKKQAETAGDVQHRQNQMRLIEIYRRVAGLNPVRRVQFKLDREKRYALLHQEDRTLDGKLIQTVDCEQFELFPKTQIWLPRMCVDRDFANFFLDLFTEEPDRTSRIKLDEISFVRPEDVSFKIDYGPGSMVTDLSIATPPPGTDR